MNELNLHGIAHNKASLLIEDFVLRNETPMRVITGNSLKMMVYLKEVAIKHNFTIEQENDYNLGSWIVK